MENLQYVSMSLSFMNLMKGRELPLKERKREIPLKERDQDLMEDFKQTDVDNNGFISFEELNQASSEVVTPFHRTFPTTHKLAMGLNADHTSQPQPTAAFLLVDPV